MKSKKSEFWRKSNYDSGEIYSAKTEDGKYTEANFYLYNKGWFRGHEDKFVVKKQFTLNQYPKSEIYVFDSKKEAEDFIEKDMQKTKTEDVTKK